MEKIWHIYKITCSITNKSYIGLTMQGVKGRFKGHLKNSRDGSDVFLHRAIRKYGAINFTIESIVECYSLKEAQTCERAQIAKLGTYAPDGYNVTIGGEGAIGMKMTPEQIEKIRKANLGRKHSEETKMKMRLASRKGKHLTEEHKRNIAIANTGYKHTDEAKAKMSATHVSVPLAGSTVEKLTAIHARTRAEREADPAKMADWKRKCSIAATGKPKSEAHKAALKAAQQRRRDKELLDPSCKDTQRAKNRLAAQARWAKVRAAQAK